MPKNEEDEAAEAWQETKDEIAALEGANKDLMKLKKDKEDADDDLEKDGKGKEMAVVQGKLSTHQKVLRDCEGQDYDVIKCAHWKVAGSIAFGQGLGEAPRERNSIDISITTLHV